MFLVIAGVEEKSFGKAANIDNDVNNLCGSPSFGSQNQLEGSSFSLEKLDINSIINMGSSLIDLLQSDEPSTMDSSFVQSTAINKLLLWKGDILKALEMTESEIELKSGSEGKRWRFVGGGIASYDLMPQEPLPWDRKDIYKDRKHERAELQPPPLLAARWREASSMSSYQHGSFREFARWGSADFRRPPGHGKQGNWHLFPEDIGGHGYVPWRSSDKILDGETYRQSVSRGDGKYGRSYSRDNNRGSYNQRDWRGHSLETSNGSPNTSVRPHDVNNEQRSVDDMFTYPSRTHSDFVNTWNQLQKDHHDNRTCGVNGLGTGQRCERENSLGSVDWKPLKWSRSGSLSSWGSGFSHSSSSKSLGGVDSGEAKLELHQKNLAPVQSPSGDAAACVTSAPPSDETTSRKKPRLGWGEGLAKFEKKKDGGPDTSINSGGAAISLCNTEPNTSLNSNLVDKSPRVLGFSDCSSPATPSSVACSSSPGNLVLEPTAEMINFTSKLLLDSRVKLYRNALKMPALILDEQEQLSRFISSNGLVEDPCAIEKERALINPWTSEEKEIFMDKLAAFGKDFRKIATFLDHKTTADCVEFYYKNHKSECFKKTTKKLDLTKQGKSSANTYLLTSGKKWSKEFNAASIDVLGAASVIATHAESGMQKHQTSSSRIFFGGRYSKISRADDRIADRLSSFDIIGNDRETAAADVLAGICGLLSSEAMSSCITSSVDPGESFHRDWKCHKVDSLLKRRSTSNVAQNVDDGTCSDESCGEMDPADWTDEEKSVFIQAVSSYGKDFAMISRCVRTRSRDQCKVFFSKARKCLGLDLIDPRTRNLGTPMSDDANGGGSDAEDACVLERLVVSSDKLGSKPEDLPSNILCTNMDERNPTSKPIFPTDLNVPDENNRKLVDHRDSEAVQTVDSVAGLAELISECSVDMNIDSKAGSLQVQKSFVALGNLNAGRDVTEQGVSVAVSASLGAAAHPCTPSLDSVAVSEPATSLYENDTKCSAETGSQSICRIVSNKASDESVGKNSCSGFSLSAKGLHQIPPDLDSAKKPSGSNNSSANGSALHDSDGLRCEKICNLGRLSSTLDYKENEAKQAQKSVREDESGRLSGKTSVNVTEPHRILRGYPLQVSTLKEMNGDVKCLATSKRGSAGPCLAQECYLQKCNSSKSAAELPLLVENLEQAKDRPKSHCRISDTENPGRNGNVKLFGQILNSSSRDDKVSHFSKQNTEPSNSKPIGNNVDGNSKFDANNHVVENVPKRSYGFSDGKRI
ncbi:hypothetical protein GOBAR_DD34137 [Gossypium barbadense]|nr:hypothetical protein GOBAR_DD34137 [Gossypium barbadense]